MDAHSTQTIHGTEYELIACLSCGAQFQHAQVGKGRKPRYCSPECRATRDKAQKLACRQRRKAGVRVNAAPRRTPVMVSFVCENCGASASREKAHEGNRFCSAKCHDDHHWERRKAEPVAERQCKACGIAFQPKGTAHVYCTTECKYRVWYPNKRAMRRANTVGNVDPFKVFDRDGWKCQLCGKPAPKRLRGSHDPLAPELDHIVPLSKGGAHTYENTQCAHRSCNMSKGAKPMGQLLLIG